VHQAAFAAVHGRKSVGDAASQHLLRSRLSLEPQLPLARLGGQLAGVLPDTLLGGAVVQSLGRYPSLELTYTEPVAAVLFAAAFLGERLSAWTLAGGWSPTTTLDRIDSTYGYAPVAVAPLATGAIATWGNQGASQTTVKASVFTP